MCSCVSSGVHIYKPNGSLAYNFFGIEPLDSLFCTCPGGYLVDGLNLTVTPFIFVILFLLAMLMSLKRKFFMIFTIVSLAVLTVVYSIAAYRTFSFYSFQAETGPDQSYMQEFMDQLIIAIPVQYLMNVIFFIVLPILLGVTIRKAVSIPVNLVAKRLPKKNAKN